MKYFTITVVALCFFVLQSCNVTRVVTVEARSYTRGDTAVHITTRTVESYDATKKLN